MALKLEAPVLFLFTPEPKLSGWQAFEREYEPHVHSERFREFSDLERMLLLVLILASQNRSLRQIMEPSFAEDARMLAVEWAR